MPRALGYGLCSVLMIALSSSGAVAGPRELVVHFEFPESLRGETVSFAIFEAPDYATESPEGARVAITFGETLEPHVFEIDSDWEQVTTLFVYEERTYRLTTRLNDAPGAILRVVELQPGSFMGGASPYGLEIVQHPIVRWFSRGEGAPLLVYVDGVAIGATPLAREWEVDTAPVANDAPMPTLLFEWKTEDGQLVCSQDVTLYTNSEVWYQCDPRMRILSSGLGPEPDRDD